MVWKGRRPGNSRTRPASHQCLSGNGGHFYDTNDLHIYLWRSYIHCCSNPGSYPYSRQGLNLCCNPSPGGVAASAAVPLDACTFPRYISQSAVTSPGSLTDDYPALQPATRHDRAQSLPCRIIASVLRLVDCRFAPRHPQAAAGEAAPAPFQPFDKRERHPHRPGQHHETVGQHRQ
jgi:hypothetical protein